MVAIVVPVVVFVVLMVLVAFLATVFLVVVFFATIPSGEWCKHLCNSHVDPSLSVGTVVPRRVPASSSRSVTVRFRAVVNSQVFSRKGGVSGCCSPVPMVGRVSRCLHARARRDHIFR